MFARLWRCQGGIKREPAAPGGPGGAQGVPQGVSGCSFSVPGGLFWGQEGSGIVKIGAGAWKKVQIQSIIGKASDLMGRATHFLPTPAKMNCEVMSQKHSRSLFEANFSLGSAAVAAGLAIRAPRRGPACGALKKGHL